MHMRPGCFMRDRTRSSLLKGYILAPIQPAALFPPAGSLFEPCRPFPPAGSRLVASEDDPPHPHSIGCPPAFLSLLQDPERFPSEDDLQVVLDEISEYREFQ